MTPYTIKVRHRGFADYWWSVFADATYDHEKAPVLVEVDHGFAVTRRLASSAAKRSARKLWRLEHRDSGEETFTYDPAEEAK